MLERYTRVFLLENQLYTEGSPIIICAGALLKDNVEDRIVAQLKFRNISSKLIKAIIVELIGYDTWGNCVGEKVRFQYLDLYAKQGDEFGAKIPIILNSNIRMFSVNVISVAFDNGSWSSTVDFEPLPKATLLSKVINEDNLEFYKFMFGKDKEIIPFEFKDIWICGCCSTNHIGGKCYKCGADYSRLSEWVDNDLLSKEKKYYQASQKFRESDWHSLAEAARIFESISEYKDSDRLAKESYEKAGELKKDSILAKGKAKMSGDVIANYEAAIKLFESISGWKNTDEEIYICQKKIEELEEKEKIKRKEAERNKRRLILVSTIICAVFIFIFILNTIIIPNHKYNDAISLIESENYIEAYDMLISLDGYKDSVEKASSIYEKVKIEKIKSAKVGDYLFFGAYEQDNNIANGNEEIEWLVLEIKDNSALLISKYVLDFMAYNTYSSTSWEKCLLRKWLNSDFISKSFSEEEYAMIPTVMVLNDKNPGFNKTNQGNVTEDKVFLLSITEIDKYFNSENEIQCEATDYAIANGLPEKFKWWLRTLDAINSNAAYVSKNGDVSETGYSVRTSHGGVRPVIWINLNP